MIRRAAIGLLVCCPVLAGVVGDGGAGNPQSAGPKSPAETSDPESKPRKPREYAPGVRIDWERGVVEVDATVVLREGMLELLACSPQTREHESIFVVQARPMHIHQAMGLIGLQPGSPIRYEQGSSRVYPPTGESLTLHVRYRHRGVEKTVKAAQWLLDRKSGHPPKKLDWVFAGSNTLDNGRFAADLEGTAICVVDFPSALITVASLHSSDNEFLWLSANTALIPPLDTPCILLIQSAAERTLAIEIDIAADGTLRRAGDMVLPTDLAGLIQPKEPASSRISVVRRAAATVPGKTLDVAVESLIRVGIARDLIEVRRSEKPPDTAPPGKPMPGG